MHKSQCAKSVQIVVCRCVKLLKSGGEWGNGGCVAIYKVLFLRKIGAAEAATFFMFIEGVTRRYLPSSNFAPLDNLRGETATGRLRHACNLAVSAFSEAISFEMCIHGRRPERCLSLLSLKVGSAKARTRDKREFPPTPSL